MPSAPHFDYRWPRMGPLIFDMFVKNSLSYSTRTNETPDITFATKSAGAATWGKVWHFTYSKVRESTDVKANNPAVFDRRLQSDGGRKPHGTN